MRGRIAGRLVIVAVLAALLVFLTDTVARPNSVWDHLGLLVDIRHQLVNEYVDEPDQKKMMEEAVRGMVRSLNDPHTAYLTQEEFPGFEKQMTGRFTGIGAMIDQFENRLRIVTPLEDSPAWRAGVLAGDIILDIEGESTIDMKPEQAVELLTGEIDTHVTILVRHESGDEQTITITRGLIEIHTVRGLLREVNQQFDYMLDDVNAIGYVRITQFSDHTAEELEQVLTELRSSGLKGLILDLRFDPGGLLDAAVAISDMFLQAGQRIVSIEGRAVPKTVHEATDETILPDVPLVVVANGASASAAEIVTGALADNKRALFVGTRTFGKGSVQTVKRLDDDQGALKITNAYYFLPSGRNIHRRLPAKGENKEEGVWGVDPSPGAWVPMSPQEVEKMMEVRRDRDLVKDSNGSTTVEITPQWIETELKDPQLAAALRAVREKIETGQWPQVGQSGHEQLIKLQKRQSLERRRHLLRESLDKIEDALIKLENPEAEEGALELTGQSSFQERPHDDTLPLEDPGELNESPATQPAAAP